MRVLGLFGTWFTLLFEGAFVSHKVVNVASMKREIVSGRRRLQHKPYYYWYGEDGESLETKEGVLPTLSCPLGHYREMGNKHLRQEGGLRLVQCFEKLIPLNFRILCKSLKIIKLTA